MTASALSDVTIGGKMAPRGGFGRMDHLGCYRVVVFDAKMAPPGGSPEPAVCRPRRRRCGQRGHASTPPSAPGQTTKSPLGPRAANVVAGNASEVGHSPETAKGQHSKRLCLARCREEALPSTLSGSPILATHPVPLSIRLAILTQPVPLAIRLVLLTSQCF